MVSVVDTYQYPDPEDVFSREPFVVKFSAPRCGEAPLPYPRPSRGPAHRSHPDLTRSSCSRPGARAGPAARRAASGGGRDRRSLRRVPGRDRQVGHRRKPGPAISSRRRALGPLRGAHTCPTFPQDLVFLGDFNADCSYVRAQDWAAIRLRSSEVFKWLIQDNADTTVSNSDCAYDRIVVCGSRLRRSLKPQSATVHDFQEEFGLDQTQASAGPGRGGIQGSLRSCGPQAFLHRPAAQTGGRGQLHVLLKASLTSAHLVLPFLHQRF